MMVTLAFAMKELMVVFQKIRGMDHDIQRPTKATLAAKRNTRKEIFQRLQGKPFWIWDNSSTSKKISEQKGLLF
jgi:hypothetical protein